MSSLYTKLRPKDFDEIVGNKTVINSIKSLVTRPLEDQPRVLLFTGPAGSGKTTTARILKKYFKTEDIDFNEYNSSNNRGIDTAREIIERLSYVPYSTFSKTKVYVLDEVHMGTKDFQNAMLKPLEDTPEHIRFILCTTNPEKLIKALVSRCEVFTFTYLSDNEIVDLLKQTCRKIGKQTSDQFLNSIAKRSNGCPRDALKMLDQIIDLKPEEIEGKLNEIILNEEVGINLCRALSKQTPWNELSGILDNLKKEDIEGLRHLIMNYFASALLKSGKYFHAFIISVFERPFYDTGRAGFVTACFTVHHYIEGEIKKRKQGGQS